METKKSESVQVASVVVEFKNNGCRDDVLRVAKEDLELGYPKELVALYAESGWQMDRCKKFSSIMRADSDGDLLRMLAEGGFNPYQMQLLANYYEKGVPVAQLRDVGAKNLTAYDMEQALKLVYQANREAETEKEKAGESPEDKDLQEKIASLTEALSQREKELGEQQEINNKQASEGAGLRIKIEGLEKQLKELEQEKAGCDSEKRSILEERDRFYRQNQTLMEEKSQLIADLEEVQKEKDEMGQRLKEMENKAVTETAGTQATAAEQTTERGITADRQVTEPADNGIGDFAGNDYLAAIRSRNGERHFVPVERSVRRKPDGLKAFAEKILGRGRQSSGLIKQLTGKGLNLAQMEQVRMAIQAGLTEQEVNDLIDSGFSAEEMAQAVEIVVAERAYQ
ncbi:MAG: hypothetical protein HFH36_13435 [Lachnospiraceae bacterium]|jgi:hypothetical protein|nr:hypothetical protein [Lachnospiraceae bacterium]